MRTLFDGPEGWANKLHVVTAISNPINYNSRYELYKEFEKRMKDAGVILWTVELAYGERSFCVTESNNPFHIQIRDGSECNVSMPIWSKEALLQIGFNRLPKEAKYICWCDADIQFQRSDWVEETIQLLQLHHIVQPWSHAQDLGPNGEPLDKKPQISFCKAWCDGLDVIGNPGEYSSGIGHPGFCWAGRRSAIEALGGLITWGILGSSDRHQAFALIDEVEKSVHPKIHPVYLKHLKIWQVRARHFIQRNISFLPGLITHAWHGKFPNRKYNERWKILVDNQFNPELDLKMNMQGLPVLTERNWRLRRDILNYFKARSEDSIDL